jgi:catechol 2,3-dioxygenase-like lactoylglutathione lyase family enzyme
MRGLLVATLLWSALPQQPAFSFHHLHLRDSPPGFLIGFYERLFDPGVTKRISFGDVNGLQAGSTVILVSPGSAFKSEPTALWHFGWGGASLGETYLAHARREVAWEPPLPGDRLHFHLRSISPQVAAAWYADVLGAQVNLPSEQRRANTPLPLPEHRMPAALVRFGEVALTIYETTPPLFSTVGQQNDHIAFACADLDAALAHIRARNVLVLSGPTRLGDHRVVLIQGPDQIAIELVESAK